MKIVLFNTLYSPNQIGGAEKSVQLLTEGLLKKAYEPIVICTSDNDSIDYINGVKVYYVKTANLYWSYNAKEENKLKKPFWHLIDAYNPFYKKIDQILENEKPDIVHTNNLAGFSVSIWQLAKKKNIKIVHTLRDYYLLCPKSTMFKNGRNCTTQCMSCKMYSIPKKILSANVDVVVGISQFILKKHLEHGYFPNAKKEVIYNSVSLPEKQLMKMNRKERENTVFGFVGTLSQEKGIEFLLEQWIRLEKSYILKVFGKGVTKEYENHLKRKFKRPNIMFMGFQKPEIIYNNIDILIVPSLWNEPFGRIVPEANSYSIPILVNNKGGLSEIVEDGVNGYVFDSDVKKDFEKKLKCISEDYKNNRFIFDIDIFSFDKIVNQYIKVFN